MINSHQYRVYDAIVVELLSEHECRVKFENFGNTETIEVGGIPVSPPGGEGQVACIAYVVVCMCVRGWHVIPFTISPRCNNGRL